jgi:RNA polymerase sigma-70 factor, ECF subfamily
MLGGAEHDAQDAVQETWLRAVQSIGGFRCQSSLRTWLCGIATNCCRELVRDRLPVNELAESELAKGCYCLPPKNPDLEGLIRSLPNGCRQVLVLHDIEGYTHEEIGVLLNVAVGTSKHQLFRARAKLRKWLSSFQKETL